MNKMLFFLALSTISFVKAREEKDIPNSICSIPSSPKPLASFDSPHDNNLQKSKEIYLKSLNGISKIRKEMKKNLSKSNNTLRTSLAATIIYNVIMYEHYKSLKIEEKRLKKQLEEIERQIQTQEEQENKTN